MGVLLVNRGSRFQGFTPEGERVLDWARRIVGDTRAMREEVQCAAARPVRPPAHRRDPDRAGDGGDADHALSRAASRTFSSPSSRATRSRCSTLLENLEIDAGITYLENEPLGRVSAVPLYRERYRLLISADAPLGNRDSVTWAEVAQVPLCLLTPDMQNRRIIDRLLQERRRRVAARRWNPIR